MQGNGPTRAMMVQTAQRLGLDRRPLCVFFLRFLNTTLLESKICDN